MQNVKQSKSVLHCLLDWQCAAVQLQLGCIGAGVHSGKGLVTQVETL